MQDKKYFLKNIIKNQIIKIKDKKSFDKCSKL